MDSFNLHATAGNSTPIKCGQADDDALGAYMTGASSFLSSDCSSSFSPPSPSDERTIDLDISMINGRDDCTMSYFPP